MGYLSMGGGGRMNKDEAVHGCGKNKNTVDCQDKRIEIASIERYTRV